VEPNLNLLWERWSQILIYFGKASLACPFCKTLMFGNIFGSTFGKGGKDGKG